MRKVGFSILEDGAIKYDVAIKGFPAAARASDYVLLETLEPVGSLVADPEMAVFEARLDAAQSLAAAKPAVSGILALIRYRRETGGIDLPTGASVLTSRETQSQIGSTFNALSSGLVSSVDWKAEGGWVTLTLTEFQPIAQAVADHVQRCFSSERVVGSMIDAAADLDALLAIDVAAEFDAEYLSRVS